MVVSKGLAGVSSPFAPTQSVTWELYEVSQERLSWDLQRFVIFLSIAPGFGLQICFLSAVQ